MKLLSVIALIPVAIFSLGARAVPLSPSIAGSPPEELVTLLATIKERLELADLVALTKWDTGKPIQDSDRELEVISAARQQANQYALGQDDVSQMLAAQIEANKLVQYGLLANWQTAGHAPKTERPNLKKDIRPHLDELQTRLLDQYAKFSPFKAQPGCNEWLNDARKLLAKDSLHNLALIRATGELCIRTRT